MLLETDPGFITLGAVVLFGAVGVFACHMSCGAGVLARLPHLRDYDSKRVSSYDTTGGNRDWWDLQPGQERTIADITGPGCIKHIWMTMGGPQGAPDAYPRRLVIKMYWDDCDEPSVECPVGDFFGLGHGVLRDFVSAPLQMSPQDGKGMNAWWAMPFKKRARITVLNECDVPFNVYFYIDYEAYPAAQDDMSYFHVQWRRENPTQGWGDEYGRLAGGPDGNFGPLWFGQGEPRSLNTTAKDNYVILEAEGDGIYCGAHLDIDVFQRQKNDWFGEGDDMIFVDGEPWPPAIHGTGTEDWYNCAFCPTTEYNAPYHGILLYTGTRDWPWKGKQTVYRYYIEDPIRFRRSIRATIEHGHANKLSNDYSSTAYYYLRVPKRGGPALPPVADRLPRPNEPQFEPGTGG
ncbi:MAG: DUF2961 domain-containing protein [Phycisphaerales bacterium]|nr:MAG: DUF2961 domain-containing protein [Phycisphaerales bacterium]